MSSTATRSRPASTRRLDPARAVPFIVMVATTGAGLWLVVGPLRLPSRVDLTVENRTPFDLVVAAGAADGDGVVVVGTVGRAQQVTLRDKVDQGDDWVFTFRYGGVDGGDLRVGRDELEAAGWRVVVPDRVGDVLLDAGLEPTA